MLEIEQSPEVVTGLLTHPNFREGIIPHIYNFPNVDLLLKCSFRAKEKGFTLKQIPKSAYREYFIFSYKHWKETLRTPAMKRLKKGK